MAKPVIGLPPTPGQLVGCWFPHREDPTIRGDKFRPCLVIGINRELGDEHPQVAVIFGGGQKTTQKNGPLMGPTQFELDSSDGNNSLAEQTRFECQNYAWLPFTSYWFCRDENKPTMVNLQGSLPPSRAAQIKAIVDAGRAAVEAKDAKAKKTNGNKPIEVVIRKKVVVRQPYPPSPSSHATGPKEDSGST